MDFSISRQGLKLSGSVLALTLAIAVPAMAQDVAAPQAAAEPAQALRRCIECGVAIGPGYLAAFRTMALADGPEFSFDDEGDLAAQA